MRAITKSLIRANKPLGASMSTHSSGQGLRTADINKWIAEIFGPSPQHNLLEQYSRTVPVYRAVKMRHDAVARAPMKAYVPDSEGELTWVGNNHEVQQHLDKFNPWWSHSNVWRAVEAYLCLWGSSFRWVDMTRPNPSDWEQWVLRPDKVVIVKDPQEYIKGFIYDPHGANFPMLPNEVIWDRYFNPTDEFSGLSPLESLMPDVIPMRNDMIKTNRNMFKNGMLAQNIAYMLKGPLTSEMVEEFYERLEQRHSGPANANRPLVVDMGAGSVETLGFSNREMEWVSGLKFAHDEILTVYGIPEEMLPGAQRTTFNNRAEGRRDFFQHTIAPEWEMLESQMQERFIPMLPTRYQNLVLRFDTSIVEGMQETVDAKADRLRQDLRWGAITPDEYRAEFGRGPLPDEIGAQPYVPSGTLPLSALEDDSGVVNPRMIDEVRCPDCERRLPINNLKGEASVYCKRCDKEYAFS